MLNQVVLVGRIASDIKYQNGENEEKKIANVTIAVPRSYKNKEGVYETDFIDITLFNGIAENTMEYCRIGDLIGVKGRIQTENIESYDYDNRPRKVTTIIAEKVTFLSSRKEN